ncbi:MAG: peptidoglycan DD-metalloendopeptidase family protein [Candidatus Moranbacteria bacterium]|jgi:murein DD-endopeptidase MepM/ murein hydrolase activator NlpD|nr:peptidoglycan DD-metalloendopeptidase family protein [Candidatus Moranbacteria bacterium]
MYNILFKITLAAGIGVLLWVLLAYTDQTDSDQSAVFLSMNETMSPSATDEVLPISDKTDATLVPISRVDERVTRKPFGILIDPETSLVQPERFRGYHTGTDFEVFPEEAEAEVYIRAVCDGTIVLKRDASGYGGVIVERCELGGETVTVIYGHLALESVNMNVGSHVEKGEVLDRLGMAGSTDTDGERKHLHLGIHRGEVVDIRGYVNRQADLSQWIDPCSFFCPGMQRVHEPTISSSVAHVVPFVVQAPAGAWHDPVFQDGCEEASILMASRLGRMTPFSVEEMKEEIRMLSMLSKELFGTTVDTSAEDTLTLFRKYTGRTDGKLLDPATDDGMQSALASGYILIVPVDGQSLGNPHFTAPGPETHMLVIFGYDPGTDEYLTHDPGTRFGASYRYASDRLEKSIRDYSTGNHLPILSFEKRVIAIGR